VTIAPTMKILHGPPGTGKTWLAAREAVAAVEPETYEQWKSGALDDKGILDAHARLVLAGRIKWVTFHPSYSYEDFVEGFRPVRKGDGVTVAFEVRKGPFRQICDLAAGFPDRFGPPEGAEVPAIGGSKTYKVISTNDQGWFLRVRPDRADEVSEEQEKFVIRSVIEKAAAQGLDPKVFSIPGKGKEVKPSAYGLAGDTEVSTTELRRMVGRLLGVSSSDLSNSAHFGAVYAFIKEQADTPPEPVPSCLVIDEINRADLSRVFGELITLLEPDKRIGALEERRVHLPYSGDDRFGVPSTLSVIGTMNTVDRSITAMDYAMRRRFAFQAVPPNPDLCPADYGGVDLKAVLTGVNRRIAILRSRDHRLGHAMLMANTLDGVRAGLGLDESAESRLKAIAHVFRTRILPLLIEYFHEDLRKIELALGTRGRSFPPATEKLLGAYSFNDDEISRFDELVDADQEMMAEPAEWWDPHSQKFSSEAFAAALGSMV